MCILRLLVLPKAAGVVDAGASINIGEASGDGERLRRGLSGVLIGKLIVCEP